MGVFSPNLEKYAHVRHDKNYIMGNELIDISDAVTGKLLHSSLAVEKSNITIQAIAFNNDGSKLAICANEMPSGNYLNGNVYLFDAESGRLDKLGGGYSPNLSDWIKFFICIFLPAKADRSICTMWHRGLHSPPCVLDTGEPSLRSPCRYDGCVNLIGGNGGLRCASSSDVND